MLGGTAIPYIKDSLKPLHPFSCVNLQQQDGYLQCLKTNPHHKILVLTAQDSTTPRILVVPMPSVYGAETIALTLYMDTVIFCCVHSLPALENKLNLTHWIN